jgi:hypothetical protein
VATAAVQNELEFAYVASASMTEELGRRVRGRTLRGAAQAFIIFNARQTFKKFVRNHRFRPTEHLLMREVVRGAMKDIRTPMISGFDLGFGRLPILGPKIVASWPWTPISSSVPMHVGLFSDT